MKRDKSLVWRQTFRRDIYHLCCSCAIRQEAPLPRRAQRDRRA